jgi:hypothetical protein
MLSGAESPLNLLVFTINLYYKIPMRLFTTPFVPKYKPYSYLRKILKYKPYCVAPLAWNFFLLGFDYVSLSYSNYSIFSR